MSSQRTTDIRQANDADYPACAQIYSEAWNFAHPSSLRNIDVLELKNETRGELILVGSTEATVYGYISIWEIDSFIHHLYIAPSKHRSGLGKALIQQATITAKGQPMSLKCKTTNFAAIEFYKAQGS